jgi:hypothetical protein
MKFLEFILNKNKKNHFFKKYFLFISDSMLLNNYNFSYIVLGFISLDVLIKKIIEFFEFR